MKILAIGAHPDDIELFMYGFLSLCKKRGDKLFLAIATDGSAGGNNENNKLSTIRENETLDALKYLGQPYFFRFKDGYLASEDKSFQFIKNYIFEVCPDLVVTHHINDYHPDHRILSNYIKEICGFNFPVLYCETLMGVNFEPDVYVDITEYFEEKKEAIMNHKSQNPKRLIEIVKTMNRYRSLQCNGSYYQYVETFKIPKQFPFLDLRNMIPKSLSIQKFNLTNTN